MKILKPILMVAIASLLTACGDPQIDTSSDEAFKSSVTEVRESLPESKREEFSKAIAFVSMSEVSNLANVGNQAVIEAGVSRLDGLTGQEVLELAEKLEAEVKQSRIEKLETDLAREEEALAKIRATFENVEDEAAQLREAVIVSDISLFGPTNSWTRNINVKMTVTNRLDVALKSVKFNGNIIVEGREVPYDEGNFTFMPDAGIESGETITDTVGLYTEIGWKSAPEDLSNYQIEVTPIQAVGANGEAVLDGVPSDSMVRKLERAEFRVSALQEQLKNIRE